MKLNLFLALLVPLFEKCIFNIFVTNINTATSYCIDTLITYKLVTPTTQSMYSSILESKDQVTPPSSLMDHSPIAVLTNGYISALNELRYIYCYFISIFSIFYKFLFILFCFWLILW